MSDGSSISSSTCNYGGVAHLANGVNVLGTRIDGWIETERGVSVSNSVFYGGKAKLSEGSSIAGSEIFSNGGITVGAAASIGTSTLNGKIDIPARLALEKVRLQGNWVLEPGAVIQSSELEAERGVIREGATIQGSRIHGKVQRISGSARIIDSDISGIHASIDGARGTNEYLDLEGTVSRSWIEARSIAVHQGAVVDGSELINFSNVYLSTDSLVESIGLKAYYYFNPMDLELGVGTKILGNRHRESRESSNWLVKTGAPFREFISAKRFEYHIPTLRFAEGVMFDFSRENGCRNETTLLKVRLPFPARSPIRFTKASQVLRRLSCEEPEKN